MRKYLWIILGLGVCIYGVFVVWFAAHANDIGVYSAFDTEIQRLDAGFIRYAPHGNPQLGDEVVRVGGHVIATWSDFVRSVADLHRQQDFPRVAMPPETPLPMLESPEYREHVVWRSGEELVRVEYRRPDGTHAAVWCAIGTTPTDEFLLSFLWFFVKLALFGVVAYVFWKRPNDDATLRFYVLCLFTIGAFMGGYHWYRIASSPFLVVVFMVCGATVPVVSLHFYLVFPRRKAFFERRPRLTLAVLYGVPGLLLAAMLTTYLTLVWVYRLAELSDKAAAVQVLLDLLVGQIYACLIVSALLFIGCVVSLVHSLRTAERGSLERKQIMWILTGALAALVLVCYTLLLAFTDAESFSLGGFTWPMFIASVCFTAAYGVSISRYGLMEVDKVLNWGIVAFVTSLVAGVAYSGMVFLGTLLIGSRIETQSPLRQAIWVSLTAWLLLIGLDVFRWRLRKAVDRRLHREKHQLDRTLRRMSEAVGELVDPPTLARHFLQTLAELVDFREGAIYLQEEETGIYRLAAHLGPLPAVQDLSRGAPLIDDLGQRVLVLARPAFAAAVQPAQRQLASLGGEVAIPLRHEGSLLAVLIAGGRRGRDYDTDELHLLRSFAQIAALALHGARGHQRIEGLNRELQAKVEKISEQQRRILLLQSQLLRQSDTVAAEEAPASFTTGIVGSSPAVQQLLQVVRKVAASNSAVLIRGESGTGKELIARALHENSPRTGKPFVKVHCAALSPGLLESELFGHVKGSFTGAHRDKIGRFELANGGTLFLDEIGDISLDVQTKLLRVLQEMTFERVGSTEPVHVDVRIIAATNQNLEKLMKEGRFREDLFYRLNVICIRTPRLRDRRDDVYELAMHFLNQYCQRSGKHLTGIDEEALELLKAYDWPGNVRELENVIERAVVLAEGPTVTADDLPEEITRGDGMLETLHGLSSETQHENGTTAVREDEWSARLEQQERERLVKALALAEGNKAKAARALGMPRSTLISKLEKYGLMPGRRK